MGWWRHRTSSCDPLREGKGATVGDRDLHPFFLTCVALPNLNQIMYFPQGSGVHFAMAEDPKPQPPSHHSNKWYKNHPEVKRPIPKPTKPAGKNVERHFGQRILDFFEHNLFTLPVGVVGGIVGILFYAPVLVVCGVCVLLAFHRAKVVSGRAFWRIQVPTYM